MGRLRLLSGGCLLVMLGALPRDCAGFQAPIVFNSLPFAGSRCGSFSLPRLAAAGTNTRSRLRSRESSVSLLAAAKDRAAGDFPDRGDGKKEDQDMDPGSPELQLPAPDSSGRIASMKQPKQPKTSLGRASVTLEELRQIEEDLKLKAVKDELNAINQKMVATIRRRRKLLNKMLRADVDLEAPIERPIKTYCTCEEFDMPHALRRLRVWSRGSAEVLDYGRVIHVRTGSRFEEDSDDESEGDVFVFPYGVVVCWGLTKEQEQELLVVLRFVAVEPVDEIEEDEFTYTYGPSFNFIQSEDQLILVTPPASGEALDRSTLEKLAASHAFSQSAKLSSFGQTVQKTIEDTRGLAAELAELGGIKSKNQQDIAKTLGRLILDRHTIYLYADVLDTPDVCWENPDLDPLYRTVNKYLELTSRIDLLNSRVEVVRELLNLLAEELQNKHASRLEEIIILLITIEIGMEFVKDVVPHVAQWVRKQAVVAKLPVVSGVTGALVTQQSAEIIIVSAITLGGMLLSSILFSLM